MRQYDCCFRYHTDYFADESRAVGIVAETGVVCIPKAVYRELTESEAIILADEKQLDALLMDEHKGRLRL